MLRKYLGFGVLKEESSILKEDSKDLEDLLGSIIDDQVEGASLFDRSMMRFVHGILNKVVIPYLLGLYEKYPEPEFHKRLHPHYCDTHKVMHYPKDWGPYCVNFDFLGNWRTHHAKDYRRFLRVAGSIKKRGWLAMNEIDIANRAITILENRYGWTVYEHEKKRIFEDICKVKSDIYQ